MITHITLETALQRASSALREKMQHSVELLRKAEHLALTYDNRGGRIGLNQQEERTHKTSIYQRDNLGTTLNPLHQNRGGNLPSNPRDEQTTEYGTKSGFSQSSSSDCLTEEQKEDLIAENIYDWWISGKPYKKWYAEKFLQQKLNF